MSSSSSSSSFESSINPRSMWISRSSYYVVDENRILLNIGTQDATLSFEDSDVARIMMDDFQTYAYEEIKAQT